MLFKNIIDDEARITYFLLVGTFDAARKVGLKQGFTLITYIIDDLSGRRLNHIEIILARDTAARFFQVSSICDFSTCNPGALTRLVSPPYIERTPVE